MHYTYVLLSEVEGRGGRYLRQRLASSLASIGDIKLERL
jgi:hypothetical protein